MTQPVNASALREAGLSRSFADHVIAGTRQIGLPLALWLHENDGLKAGPLAGKTLAEIRLMRRLYEPAAPASVLRRRANAPQTAKAA